MGKQVGAVTKSGEMTRHLRWSTFEARIQEGPPSLEPIKGRPQVMLFIEPRGARIGARFYTKITKFSASPLAEVSIRTVGVGAKQALEVSTANPVLFRDFYAFCCTLADRVQIDKQQVGGALKQTLGAWSALLRRKSLLSEERQTGLIGELLFLERIAKTAGWAAAVDAWQGPQSEEHDFVLHKVDAEVKTTRREKRVHHIGTLTQLVPKVNRSLVVISIQVTSTSADGGVSLPQLVSRVLMGAVACAPEIADVIRDQLKRQGWADEDSEQYPTVYGLRSKIAAVLVNDSFPAIVPDTLTSLGVDKVARIESVEYLVNLDGLGVLDGTKAFQRLLFSR